MEIQIQPVYIASMAKKVTYTLSEPIPNKEGSGCYIMATPNAYAATLHVNFESEDEAKVWLVKDSKGWLDRLHAGRNAKRPADPNAIAKMMVDIASGDAIISALNVSEPKTRQGVTGGDARAAKLTPSERTKIAQIAAQKRWGKAR